ncbi:MAG: AAA family ATPase [Bacillota bacterium]|nr:AAA family ATPase [Bacillota bacterium]
MVDRALLVEAGIVPPPPPRRQKETPAPAEEAAPEEQGDEPRPLLVRLADVEPQAVSWLWEPYIPKGKPTILEGDPAVGKTWLALTLAAIVSRGDPFPGPDGVPRERRKPASVVYLSAEDGLADTLRPRLDAAGADVSRVWALTGQMAEGEEKSITLADLGVLEAALASVRPALVIVDPIQAYLGGGVDMHRANEVRPVLAGLATLAEKYGAAALLIRHLGKAPQDRAIYRGLGSIDFAAAARSILLAGKDPNDESRRVLAHVKSSLAPLGPSIAYTLGPDGFTWCGVSDVTAEALLVSPRSEEEKTAIEEAGDFLREALADGPRPTREIFAEARKLGVTEKTLYRAKARLGVEARKDGDLNKKGQRAWRWHLCEEPDEQDSQGPPEEGRTLSVLGLTTLTTLPQSQSQNGFQGTEQDGHMTIFPNAPQTSSQSGLEGRWPRWPSEIRLEGPGREEAAATQGAHDDRLDESPLRTPNEHLGSLPPKPDEEVNPMTELTRLTQFTPRSDSVNSVNSVTPSLAPGPGKVAALEGIPDLQEDDNLEGVDF